MTPLVVTSLDPADRPAHQHRCMAAWRRLGCDVVSFNTPAQADALRALDPETGRLVETLPDDTGPALHVLPVLAEIQRRWPGRTVVLVKPDVFPAVTDATFIDLFLKAAPALALSREETAIVEGYGFADRGSVPDRIDTFLIGPDRLDQAIEGLSRWNVAQRMRFDVFGWEYLLAAVLAASDVGGRIMEGAVLLHERHRHADSGAADSAAFMEPLGALGMLQGPVDDPLPARFATAVRTATQANAATSARVKALCFAAARRGTPASARARSIALRLQSTVPWARWNYNFHTLAALADRILAGEDIDFFHLSQVLQSGPSRHHQFAEALLAVLFDLLCHETRGRRLGTRYPPRHYHAPAVIALMNRHKDDPVQRRLELARLFGADMVDRQVFNPRIFDALVLSCQNDDERLLLNDIHLHTKELLDAA